jgi:hypothetical protein
MNLTNEVLEMWEEDARRGSTDGTAANARVLRLVTEVRETSDLLKQSHDRLMDVDAAYRDAVERTEP